MTPKSEVLGAVGFYAEAHNQLYLDARPDALRQLAAVVRTEGSHPIVLSDGVPPGQGWGRIMQIEVEVQGSVTDRIAVSRQATQMRLIGGTHAMSLLAETLEELATAERSANRVPHHVDLGFFEGNQMLEDTGYGLTITLVP